MSSIHVALLTVVASAVIALAGCTELKPAAPPTPIAVSPNQRYYATNLDQLLAYGADLARLARADLLSECNKVLALYVSGPDTGVLLHLFMAQLASGACGDLARVTSLVRALRATLDDDRLRKYLTYQTLLAQRAITEAAERDDLADRFREAQGRLKKAKSTLVQAQRQLQAQRREQSKERRSYQDFHERLRSQDAELRSRDAEARQLREKLDALKSIEEDLDGIVRQNNHE